MSTSSRPRLGVVLVNLGTPDSPTPAAVRRYLRQFLSDPRVIEVPRFLWWLILNLFILPFRPRRVAANYALIWEDGDSPMRRILREQCTLLATELTAVFPGADIRVEPAMTYGQPALASALAKLQAERIEKVVLVPMFPQYSATSSAAAYDALGQWLARQRNLPAVTVIKDYFAHPLYIAALAASIEEHRMAHGHSERLLFSFHGIPEAYAEKGDPYPERCRATAALVAERLRLPPEAWAASFQSRFGRQPWVQPYTDELLSQWARSGIASVQVVCPAFSADCLETLEEIAGENRELFLHAGGGSFQYIPALNTRPDHIALLLALVQPHLAAHIAA
ncbi:MAG: ferrochelatase-2, chloroplastic-like [Moraxellaceae bacterium]|nr:ferrochelatase-2, chloroplastic-like [Moraxellaceae bacterium]